MSPMSRARRLAQAAEFPHIEQGIQNAVLEERSGKPLIVLMEREGLEPSTPAL
jgi:hypothetical protein